VGILAQSDFLGHPLDKPSRNINIFIFLCRYAMEAISNAGSCIGVLTREGVVLAAEKRITSKVGSFAARFGRNCDVD
jgi:hypothetical protein